MSVQKIPPGRYLPPFAQRKALDEIKKRGYGLPCHLVNVEGPLVEVAFDVSGVLLQNVSITTCGSQYQRQPFQVGDKGFTIALAVDASLLAGLGTSLPTMDLPANMSALFWMPAGSVKFPPAEDPNAHILYGPNGVILRTENGDVSLVLNTNSVTIDSPTVSTSGNLDVGTGASGVFTSATGQVITVQDGIVTNID